MLLMLWKSQCIRPQVATLVLSFLPILNPHLSLLSLESEISALNKLPAWNPFSGSASRQTDARQVHLP